MRKTWLAMPAVVALLLAACGGEAADNAGAANGNDAAADDGADEPDPVTLTLITTLSEDNLEHEGVFRFVELLEDEAPWVEIDYVGGPDVVPTPQVVQAVSEGQFDMTDAAPAFYEHFIPAGHALPLRSGTPAEEREDGTYDLMQEYFDEFNLHHLGTTVPATLGGALYLRDVDLDPADPSLEDLTLRAGAQYAGLIERLGGSVVNFPIGEIYTAMERGTIDGFGAPSAAMYQHGFMEVVDTYVQPYFNSTTYSILLNQDAWDDLDEQTQQAMNDVMVQVEGEMVDAWEQHVADEEDQRAEDGIHPIVLEEEAAEEYLRLAEEGTREQALKADPDNDRLLEHFGVLD